MDVPEDWWLKIFVYSAEPPRTTVTPAVLGMLVSEPVGHPGHFLGSSSSPTVEPRLCTAGLCLSRTRGLSRSLQTRTDSDLPHHKDRAVSQTTSLGKMLDVCRASDDPCHVPRAKSFLEPDRVPGVG